jgi:hypothetical protein
VLTTLRPLSISVNESDASVWVDAGVKTSDLLQYLSQHVTPQAPSGWSLGAFPWFVYQSVGGAVATGTHGSNLGPHKSMSNQVGWQCGSRGRRHQRCCAECSNALMLSACLAATDVEALPCVCAHGAVCQVLALDVALANGTRRTFTPEADPFLFKVGVTRLATHH